MALTKGAPNSIWPDSRAWLAAELDQQGLHNRMPTPPATPSSTTAPSPAPRRCFALLHERPLPGEVSLSCWSPTMDLLALVMDDGQLSIHRLDWQKLWVALPDTPITTLCWRPDGKLLATGHTDGSSSLYDVEKSELLHRGLKLHKSQVCALSWVEATTSPPAACTANASSLGSSDGSMHSQMSGISTEPSYRHPHFFAMPPLPPIAPCKPAPAAAVGVNLGMKEAAHGATRTGTAAALGHWPSPPDVLNFLVSCDVHGSVVLLAFGTVHLATILPPQTSFPRQAVGAGLAGAGAGAGTGSKAGAADENAETHAAATCQAFLTRDLRHVICLGVAASVADVSGVGHGLDGTGRREPSISGAVTGTAKPPNLPLSPPMRQQAAGPGRPSAVAVMPDVQRVVLNIYDASLLQQQQREVHMLAVLSAQLSSMLEVCSRALSTAYKEWHGAQGELRKRMRQLEDTIELVDNRSPALGAAQELSMMLATGHVTSGMHSYFSNTLTEPGLRRLAKQLDSAVQAVHALLLNHVGPAAEVATFIIGELKGLAAAVRGVEVLGLQAPACALAELEGCKLLLQCERLRLLLTRVGVQYRALFTWLLKTYEQLEGAKAPTEGQPAQEPVAGSLAHAQVDFMDILELLEGPEMPLSQCTNTGMDGVEEGEEVVGQLSEDQIIQDLQAVPLRPYNCVGSMSYDSPLPLKHLQALMSAMHPLQPHLATADTPANAASGRRNSRESDVMDTDAPLQSTGSRSSTDSRNGGGRATGGAAVSTWPNRPLRAQLSALSELCKSTFEQLHLSISPRISLVAQVPLFHMQVPRSPSAAADDVLALQVQLQLPQLRTEAVSDGTPVHICCHVPSEAAGRPGEPDQLLMLQLRISKQHNSTVQATGQCLTIPAGSRVRDLTFYKQAQLAVLLQTACSSRPAIPSVTPFSLVSSPDFVPPLNTHTQPSAIHSSAYITPIASSRMTRRRSSGSGYAKPAATGTAVTTPEATGRGTTLPSPPSVGPSPMRMSSPGLGPTPGFISDLVLLPAPQKVDMVVLTGLGSAILSRDLLQSCQDLRAVQPWPKHSRQRRCTSGLFVPPIAVSAQRGVAAAFRSDARVDVLDMEDNEEEEEEAADQAEDGSPMDRM